MIVGAVLLDLDGTLVDTAPDLVAVLNQMLREHGEPPMPFAIARNEVSNGALGLIRLGFGEDLSEHSREELRLRFLEIYTNRVCIKSRLFIDIHSILNNSKELNVPWGIVTNKAQSMTEPLLEQLGIASQPSCVVSGDRLPQRKPHPAPLQLAARELGLAVEECVYVGDARRDIDAGRAAGMHTIAVSYGYIRPDENLHSWGADLVIRRPNELEPALSKLRNGEAPVA
jgi:N-acetyl-D-muramate 6-phosphate phosphatase